MKNLIWSLIFIAVNYPIFSDPNPLTPLKFNSPKETMKAFLDYMNNYKKGIETNDSKLTKDIEKAIQTFDISKTDILLFDEKKKEAAIFLKEVLDRVYVPDYKKIPDYSDGSAPLKISWTVPDTEITIVLVQEGKRAGEFLFSNETVQRAGEFFEKVKHLPYLKGTGSGAAYQAPWSEVYLPEWSKKKFLVFEIWKWIGLLLAIFVGILINTLSRFIFKIILKFTKKTKTEWDEKIVIILYRPIGYLLVVAFWFGFLFSIDISGTPYRVILYILKILLGLAFVYFVYCFSELVVALMRLNAIQKRAPIDEQLIPLLIKSFRILFVTLAVLFAIQNLGINVMSLIAGLGIGGLALALAAKDTAANLFGSIMIFMDKPFRVGEHIIVGGIEGTVEAIGFRSTRIRTWEDSVVTIPNSTVANANIENLGLRRYRRTNMIFGVTYDTSPEKMEAFLEAIKNILFSHPLVVKELVNVGFREFGNSSLNIQMHFYINVDTFAKNLEVRQLIFLDVMRAAKALDISFAFPTTTLHVESFPEKTPTRTPKDFKEEEYKQKAKDFGAKPFGAGIFKPPYKHLEEQNSNDYKI